MEDLNINKNEPSNEIINRKVNDDRIEKISGLRRIMVKTMTDSLNIPHLGYNEEVIMNELSNIRMQIKPWASARKLKISYMPFIVKAASLALTEFPVINSSIVNNNTEVIIYSKSR